MAIQPNFAKRASVAVEIYALLRDDIVGVKRLPGDRIQEKEYAASLGVSRTPVREAILRLADEGLVEIYPQRGTFVSRIKTEDALDALFMRTTMEGAAIEIATKKDAAAVAAALQSILNRQVEIAETHGLSTEFYALDEEFHKTILVMAGHEAVWRTLNAAKAHMDRVRRLILPDPGHLPHVIGGHESVIEAVKAGDGAAAKIALQEHLEPFRDIVDTIAERHPEYFSFPPRATRPAN